MYLGFAVLERCGLERTVADSLMAGFFENVVEVRFKLNLMFLRR
jgi:hypothetical protein